MEGTGDSRPATKQRLYSGALFVIAFYLCTYIHFFRLVAGEGVPALAYIRISSYLPSIRNISSSRHHSPSPTNYSNHRRNQPYIPPLLFSQLSLFVLGFFGRSPSFCALLSLPPPSLLFQPQFPMQYRELFIPASSEVWMVSFLGRVLVSDYPGLL